jgi:N-acetylglucosaminyldiphosphoundecaprenol N-acetyl-beta-D-mannosaminyltransferase
MRNVDSGTMSKTAERGLPEVVPIAGVEFHPLAFDQAVDWIVNSAKAGVGGVVCTPNVDYVVRARRDAAFRAAIAAADLRVPDGMWIVYAARIAGLRIPESVTGRLLVPAVARIAQDVGMPIALYGAGPGVAHAAGESLRRRYPALKIVATVTPPTPFQIGSAADQQGVEELRDAGARVIFVALGAPKQEVWMDRHRDDLSGAVLVGVGAAFDIIAGRFREAPRWMTRIGLEWLFRLVQEPRRLARRYLIEDPWILLWAVRTRRERGGHR